MVLLLKGMAPLKKKTLCTGAVTVLGLLYIAGPNRSSLGPFFQQQMKSVYHSHNISIFFSASLEIDVFFLAFFIADTFHRNFFFCHIMPPEVVGAMSLEVFKKGLNNTCLWNGIGQGSPTPGSSPLTGLQPVQNWAVGEMGKGARERRALKLPHKAPFL